MKLVAFRIVNFKSIIDTGWKDLSADNITGLIGQNESGKSSILEGLSSFYDGNLKEDALRSDGSIPSIGCSFEISDKELSELFDDYLLSNNLLSVISKNKNRINITRSWDEISTEQSKMSLEQSSLIDFFNKTEAKNKPIINSSIAPLTLTPNTIITNSLYVSPINSEQSIAQERIEINNEQFTNGIIENLPVFELFQDNTSLLPETIDIIDLKNDNPKTNGIKGAQNFLTITGLNIDDIIDGNERVIERKIRSANDKLTVDFQKFWSQYVGKSNKIEIEFNLKHHDTTNPAMAGQPYLVFWVKDGVKLPLSWTPCLS